MFSNSLEKVVNLYLLINRKIDIDEKFFIKKAIKNATKLKIITFCVDGEFGIRYRNMIVIHNIDKMDVGSIKTAK